MDFNIDEFENEYDKFIKELEINDISLEDIALKIQDKNRPKLKNEPILNRINLTNLISKRIKDDKNSKPEVIKEVVKEVVKIEKEPVDENTIKELKKKIKEEVKKELKKEEKDLQLVSKRTKYKKKAAEIPSKFYWNNGGYLDEKK